MQHLLREKEVAKGSLQQWRKRNGNRSCLVRISSLETVKDIKVLPEEDLASQHRPLLADIAINLPKKSRTRTERRIQFWKMRQFKRERPEEKVVEGGLPNPEGYPADLEQRCEGHPAMCKGNAGGNSRWFPRGQGGMVLE
ncbi:unnamed protein product [Haemonchus placei]|uniref:Homeobox domain-containing protein n=1 Tax=Haemonchus placei TaxID=6290 RepID=A0A0N4W3F1_HAEPC|nr:unnamed protein product [Haemonchus placei]